MLIFFVRHGLTDWNALRRFQGTSDIPLNDIGVRQAQAAAHRLSGLQIERIYHSTLMRAAYTAQIISDETHAPCTPHTGFNEVCMGCFQGLTHDEALLRYPKDYSAYLSDPACHAPDGGENLLTLQQRALRALAFCENDAAAAGLSRIAVVSHGALLKALVCALMDLPLSHFSCFDVSNGSITIVESAPASRRIVSLNDIAHFGDPYSTMQAARLMI